MIVNPGTNPHSPAVVQQSFGNVNSLDDSLLFGCRIEVKGGGRFGHGKGQLGLLETLTQLDGAP